MEPYLPDWAQTMRAVFRADAISQFIITGNIHDFVLFWNEKLMKYLPLKSYLNEVLFAPFDVVLFYDRGHGIQLAKGSEFFFQYLQIFDKFHQTRFASDAGVKDDPKRILEMSGLLPRAPEPALELIDRFLINTAAVALKGAEANKKNDGAGPKSIAVVLDYANLITPRGDSLYLGGEFGANLIKILGWSREPLLANANIATVLLTENLTELHESVVNNPFSAKIQINLPNKEEIETYLRFLTKEEPDFPKICEIEIPVLAGKLVGLSQVNIKSLILRALRNREPVTLKFLSQLKKEIIEKESFDKLEFIESKRTLGDVAGNEAAKQWFREDAQLLKKGATHALPMGYLITGRIGTGKTYLVECFAGECGIPFVALKNFRDKWVGATEGNLEKIFHILRALGQVVVFIDEADQLTGRRDSGQGDSGLSGRIYGMLAKEMADTQNRGKIIWILATSRPDLLEVDLKRQGRLDVHIPLFPPAEATEVQALFLAMAKKLELPLKPEDLPELAFKDPISGNELEGLLVRASREYELRKDSNLSLAMILKKLLGEFRPSAHRLQMELMDLLAVKECTDERFLPERFRKLNPTEIEAQIEELKSGFR
jgi:SpoVK/Ycf46/Vps4 family AAA+-type ATPase